MNQFDIYLIKIFWLILGIIFLTIVLSYLSLLIRFVPKHRRLVLVRTATDITVLGPGWVFLKPYRERLSKIDIRVQQCEIGQPIFQKDKILYSFKIMDTRKSITAALQHAKYVLEQSKASDKQKEIIRYSSEFNSPMGHLEYLTKTMVAKSYIKFAKDLNVEKGVPSNAALEGCGVEIEDLFKGKGLQLINIAFSMGNDPRK